jgi:hypothetical protein
MMQAFWRFGIVVGLALVTYGLYLFITIRVVNRVYQEFNADISQFPYLIPLVVTFSGILLVSVFLTLIKRASKG